MKEIWKDIPNYEGLYQVSNLGRVKSLDRIDAAGRKLKSKVFKIDKNISGSGYQFCALSKGGKVRQRYIHQLVAMAFLNHKPDKFKIVVDHINNNKLDNRLENLQLLSNRQNSSKNVTGSSKYTGVRKTKYNTFRASIRINGKKIELGTFKTEIEAHKKYQEVLNAIT
jgi:hypothetical protein